MAHYAFLDQYNQVIEVITGRDENEVIDGITDWEKHYGDFRNLRCVRTSYNTRGNKYVGEGEGTPFRYNYATTGGWFDQDKGTHGAFIPPKPFSCWVLNQDTYLWEAPVPCPSEDEANFDPNKMWIWIDPLQTWLSQPVQ